MGVDVVRLFLRWCCLGFILGKFKKRESKNGHSRGFVNAVFPLPANCWTAGNDFLWEPKKPIPQEIREKDWIVFLGYRTPSGWKAKLVLKIFLN
jgi:hypothetical protein